MINKYGSPFGEDDSLDGAIGTNSPPHKSTLIPLLSLLVTLVSVVLAQFQQQRTRFWALIGVGVLGILVGYYQHLVSSIRKILRRVHNARVVRRNRQELRRFSREAGIFLDSSTSRNDTLQGVLQDVSQRLPTYGFTNRIPNVGIFHEHWNYLDARIRTNGLSAGRFHDAAEELLSLMRSYTSFSVLPVFYMFAAEFRQILLDNEKSRMNGFQQQYLAFLNNYSNYLLRLNDEFHGLPKFQPFMAKPSPL